MAPHDLLLLLVDQKVDSLAGAEGVRPLLHLEGILHLGLAQLEEELLALGIVELHWVGDLGVRVLLGVLLGLDKLLEVVVEGVSELAVLSLAPELVAEGEQVCGHLVVEVEKLGVLAESVHDHLGHTCVEVDPGDQPILVDDVFKVAISK